MLAHKGITKFVTVAMATLIVGGAAPAALAATVTVAAGGDIAKPDAPGKRQTQTANLITNVIRPAKVGDRATPSRSRSCSSGSAARTRRSGAASSE